jgi:plasmid maintenance system antidote protein VapI
MPTYLESKLEDARCGVAPVARKLGLRFSTVALVVRGQMHVTPDVMQRVSTAIDQVKADREAG